MERFSAVFLKIVNCLKMNLNGRGKIALPAFIHFYGIRIVASSIQLKLQTQLFSLLARHSFRIFAISQKNFSWRANVQMLA